MISNTIRAYNTQQNRYPSVFLYQNTTTGIFYISDVEAEITEGLSPLEQLCLELTSQLGSITRIEAHAFSGIGLEVCDETLRSLQYHGLLVLREYDVDRLDENLNRISTEIGDDWETNHIKELRGRKLLKQYELSEDGKSAVETKSKTVRKNTDLDLIVTGTPFYVFYDTLDLRSDGYELVDMDRNLVKHLLGHAERHAEYTGIKPLSIGATSVTEGKEVSNAQFWITLAGDQDQHLDDVDYRMYLSSKSFERWTSPSWNGKLREMVPKVEYVEDLVIDAMSETWMMVKDVIEEGLKLGEDKITWKLEADLEMQKLIYNVMPEPIADVKAEIKLKLPNTDWKVVMMLQLEAWDELAETSLIAGRFHAMAPRKGFTLEEGYIGYQEMMQEWDKPVKRQQYRKTLDTLVEYNCLIERIPKVRSIVVDVDDVLSHNRRERQNWQFNRLREIEKILKENEIDDIRYLASNIVKQKVDDQDSLNKWIANGKIEIIDNFVQEVPETIERARQTKSHYLGSKVMSKGDKQQEYSRTIKYKITKKRLTIPGLEPFYDWRMENLFDKMYNVYYE